MSSSTASSGIRALVGLGVALLAATGCTRDPVLLCGADEVFLVDTATARQDAAQKLWSWRATQREDLPAALRDAFAATDDCKSLDGGKRVLISSSSGGCALVERPSGRVLWYARVPNAHSLELLPHGRVVVAGSVGKDGSRLLVFDLARSDQPIWDTPLPAAHGVVWDEQRRYLWALGYQELRRYELADWEGEKPSLSLHGSFDLPSKGGHDLRAVPQSNDLTVTTEEHVYLFDRENRQFRLHPELGTLADVKCVSIHPRTGRLMFVQGHGKEWWSDTLHFLSPTGELQLKGERLYKARWLSGATAQDGK